MKKEVTHHISSKLSSSTVVTNCFPNLFGQLFAEEKSAKPEKLRCMPEKNKSEIHEVISFSLQLFSQN